MTNHYKFLDAQDVDKVLVDGTIIISSFNFYRQLEEKDWSLMSDPKPSVICDSPQLELVNSANVSLETFENPVQFDNGVLVNVGAGVQLARQIEHGHIFCCSVGELDELIRRMTGSASRKYDAVLKIKDLGGLTQHVLNTGIIRNDGNPVSNVFRKAFVDRVQYEDRSRDNTEGPVIPRSPFKKSGVFEGQSEARVLFKPTADVYVADRLTVKIVDPMSFFEAISLPQLGV